MTDRLPPHNPEAERQILGAIYLDNNALALVREIIEPEDFYLLPNRTLYSAMLSIDGPIDTATLYEQLGDSVSQVGGLEAITRLGDDIATTVHCERHAQIVRDVAVQRRAMWACSEFAKSCYTGTPDRNQFLSELQDILKYGLTKIDPKPIAKTIGETYMRIVEGEKTPGLVKTGITKIDQNLGGIYPGVVTVVAGRPGMGKTALALNMATQAAKGSGLPSIVFSLEMSKDQLIMRMLSSEGWIDAQKMRSGKLDSKDLSRMIQATAVLSELPVYIDDSTPMTVVEISAKARRLKSRNQLGLVVE